MDTFCRYVHAVGVWGAWTRGLVSKRAGSAGRCCGSKAAVSAISLVANAGTVLGGTGTVVDVPAFGVGILARGV